MVKLQTRETTTPSLRQGHFCEEGSEGSQRQICEPTNRNVIEGRDSPGASWHNTTKPSGSGNTVNDAVVQRQFTRLSGEVCTGCYLEVYGSLIEVSRETAREPQNPKENQTARLRATSSVHRTEVSRGHSSPLKGEGLNMNEIRRSHEQLKPINEPVQGR
jgi:hypothetical protein